MSGPCQVHFRSMSGIWNLDFGSWSWDCFFGLRMTQGYKLDHSLSHMDWDMEEVMEGDMEGGMEGTGDM